MAREKWKLTRDADGQPQVDVYGDRLVSRRSLLAELAEDPRNGLVQVGPGVYLSRQMGIFRNNP